MTINNAELFVAGIWDWGFLDECFAPTRIRITDGDGIVERNGYFLLIETKKKGANIPIGQQILFDAFVRQGNHVMIIWGYQSDDLCDTILLGTSTPYERKAIDKNDLKTIVRQWFEWANKQNHR